MSFIRRLLLLPCCLLFLSHSPLMAVDSVEAGPDDATAGNLNGAIQQVTVTRGNHLVPSDVAQRMVKRLQALLGQPSLKDLPPGRSRLPTTGTVSLPVFLVELSDAPHVNPPVVLSSRLFGSGSSPEQPYDSLKYYYGRSSFNKLVLTGGVFGWHTSTNRWTDFASIDPAADPVAHLQACQVILEEVVSHYATEFGSFDADNDGIVDCVVIIWSVPPNSTTMSWPMSFWFSDTNSSFVLGGKRIKGVVWVPELGASQKETASFVRSMCHEMGHALGLPDYYDGDTNSGPAGGLGGLDMMDDSRGDHNAFSKFMLGWLTPTILTNGHSHVPLRPSADKPDALLIMPGYSGNTALTEFFLVENRYRVGNDMSNSIAANPGDGILMWHVDATLSGNTFAYNNSTTDHKLLRLMEADEEENPPDIEDGALADAGDYYTLDGYRTFTDETIPCSVNYQGIPTYVSVGVLSSNGYSMEVCGSIGGTPPIVYLESPDPKTIEAGDPANFTAFSESNIVSVFHQWYLTLDGVESPLLLTGQITTNLVLSKVQEADEGFYSIVSSNCLGCITNETMLSVVDTTPPTFFVRPIDHIWSDVTSSCMINVPNVIPYVTAHLDELLWENSDGPVTLTQYPPPGLCCESGYGGFCPQNCDVAEWTIYVDATDSSGNRGEGWFWVGLTYDSPVNLVVQTNLTLAATSNCIATLPALENPNLKLIHVESCWCGRCLGWSQKPEAGTALGLGNHFVELTCHDPSGHEDTAIIAVSVVDRQPPTLVCPSNRVVTIPASSSGTIVTFDDPSANDNCPGPVNIVCDPPSGSVFTPGINLVNCTAADASGNTNSCTFRIRINRTPVAAPDALQAVENQPAVVSAFEFVANDRDADQDFLEITAVSPASAMGGSVGLAGTVITYQPPANFDGTDSFTYTVSDWDGATATALVEITVRGENDPALHRIWVSGFTEAQVAVSVRGVPGRTYRLERFDAAGQWTPVTITSGKAPGNGVLELKDPDRPPDSSFYRVAW